MENGPALTGRNVDMEAVIAASAEVTAEVTPDAARAVRVSATTGGVVRWPPMWSKWGGKTTTETIRPASGAFDFQAGNHIQ